MLLDFFTKQVEKKLGVDLDGDGKIGSGRTGTSAHGASGGMMNQFEKAVHMDLNGDGRVGGAGTSQGTGQYYASSGAHGYAGVGSGGGSGGFMGQLEKATHMDLNGDGRVGGGNTGGNAYGNPQYPNQHGSYF